MRYSNHTSLNKMVAFSAIAFTLFQSCTDKPDDIIPEPKAPSEYGIWVTAGNASTDELPYVLLTDDLMKDTVLSPLKAGIDASGSVDGTYGDVHNGYYYAPDDNKISKSQIINGKFSEIDNVIINDADYSTYIMKHYWNNYFNVLSWAESYNNDEKAIQKKLFIIKPDDMTMSSSPSFKFPYLTFKIADPAHAGQFLKDDDISISPTSFTIRGDKAFVGFVYWNWDNWIHTDSAYMLVCDYPSLTNSKLLKEGRYGYMSGTWWQSNSSFMDEKGDYYFTTVDKNNKYTLLRIKSGETEFDKAYAFDLKNYKVYIEGYGGQYDHHTYLKNGLALLGSYIVDVWNQKVVKDLNSYGIGTVQECYRVYVEDNKLYVFIKTSDSKWFIARYNPDDNSFVKGAEISGGVQSVARIDKLK